MQKWFVPTDRFQIADEKTGVICLVIRFTEEYFSVALKFLAKVVTNFLLPSAWNTKRAMSYILITIILEENMIFTIFLKILTPFFHLLFELHLLVDPVFAFQELQNSISKSRICLTFWSVKYTLTCQW